MSEEATLRFKAVVFDLDGVVVRTSELHFQAWEEVFNEFLKDYHSQHSCKEPLPVFTQDDYLKYVDGLPRHIGVHNYLKSQQIDLPIGSENDDGYATMSGIGKMKDKKFLELVKTKGVGIYESTVDLIKELRSMGVKTAVASSSRNCHRILEQTSLECLFDVRVDGVVSRALELKGKPDPDIFLCCCQLLGVSAAESVVVEDAINGVTAGHNGGFGVTLGIDRAKGKNREALRKNGATIVVEDLSQFTVQSLNDIFPHAMPGWTLAFGSFNQSRERLREALCTLANGYISTRASQHELRTIKDPDYHHYCSTYIAGCYNVATTKLHGEITQSDELVNFPNWKYITFRKEGEEWFDWSKVPELFEVSPFQQQLNVRDGTLIRRFRVTNLKTGSVTTIISQFFVSMKEKHLAAIKYIVIAENWSGKLEILSGIDGDVQNKGVPRYRELNPNHIHVEVMGEIPSENRLDVETKYPESRWEVPEEEGEEDEQKTTPVENGDYLSETQTSSNVLLAHDGVVEKNKKEGVFMIVKTMHSRIEVAMASKCSLFKCTTKMECDRTVVNNEEEKLIGEIFSVELKPGDIITAEKTVAIFTSKDRAISTPEEGAFQTVNRYNDTRFNVILRIHQNSWASLWSRGELHIQLASEKPTVEPHATQDAYYGSKKDTSNDLACTIENGCFKISAPFGDPSKQIVDHDLLLDLRNSENLKLECIDVQFILRFHTFHIAQTISKNSMDLDVGIPARGLHGESYRGHIFWDEMFVYPFINFKVPDLTRSLLLYRYYRLPAAKDRAAQLGYKGALYSWQSASSGIEETPTIHYNPMAKQWFPDNSSLQIHVNIAVFYSIWNFFEATGDMRFMELYGAEVLLEICKFWASKATFNKGTGRFEILGVMGPDEFHEGYPGSESAGVDNNAYINVMVAANLLTAIRLLSIIPEMRRKELEVALNITNIELQRWEAMTKKLTVIFNEDYIISQFQGFDDLKEIDWKVYKEKYGNIQRLDRILQAENDSPNNYKLNKQPDVCMIFYLLKDDETICLFNRLGYPFTRDLIRKNIEYYYNRTSHGSTISKMIFSSIWHRFDTEIAWKLYTDFITSDICDIQQGTTAEGIHMVPMAGSLIIILNDFFGVDSTRKQLHFNPSLPEGIAGISLNLEFMHQWLQINLTHKKLQIRPLRGVEKRIHIVVRGKQIQALVPGSTVEIGLADNSVQTTADYPKEEENIDSTSEPYPFLDSSSQHLKTKVSQPYGFSTFGSTNDANNICR